MTITHCWSCSKGYPIEETECPHCGHANANADFSKASAQLEAQRAAPVVAAAPQLPPEVWQTQPVDAERAWAATRAMCAGVA